MIVQTNVTAKQTLNSEQRKPSIVPLQYNAVPMGQFHILQK